MNRTMSHHFPVMLFAAHVLMFMISPVSSSYSQSSLAFGYDYLYNKKLDNVYQTYNFSRRFYGQSLMPVSTGYSISYGYNVLIQQKVQLHMNPLFYYRRFSTSAENEGVRLVSTLHQTGVGIDFRFNPRALIKGVSRTGPLGTRFFLTLTPGYQFVQPVVRKDKVRITKDSDERFIGWSGGFYASAGIGWNAMMIGRAVVTPELTCSWMQTMKLENLPEDLFGTNVMNLRDEFENVFVFRFSLRFTLLEKESNWWDRPRAGDKQ